MVERLLCGYVQWSKVAMQLMVVMLSQELSRKLCSKSVLESCKTPTEYCCVGLIHCKPGCQAVHTGANDLLNTFSAVLKPRKEN